MTIEVALTRSKWLSTFVIDLKPYEKFFSRLSDDLRKAGIATQQILTFAVICPDKGRETLIVHPPLGMIKLIMSCVA